MSNSPISRPASPLLTALGPDHGPANSSYGLNLNSPSDSAPSRSWTIWGWDLYRSSVVQAVTNVVNKTWFTGSLSFATDMVISAKVVNLAEDTVQFSQNVHHFLTEDPIGKAISKNQAINLSGLYLRPYDLLLELQGGQQQSSAFPSHKVEGYLTRIKTASEKLHKNTPATLRKTLPLSLPERPSSPTSPSHPPANEVLPPSELPKHQETLTNQNLDAFSRSLSSYATFHALFWACSIPEAERESGISQLLEDLKKAESEQKSTTLWALFKGRYGQRMGWRASIWCLFAYFFVHTLGIVPKILHTYLESILQALRSSLTGNGKSQADHFKKIVGPLDKLLDEYIAAHTKFVSAGKGLDECIEEAFANYTWEMTEGNFDLKSSKIEWVLERIWSFFESISFYIRWIGTSHPPRIQEMSFRKLDLESFKKLPKEKRLHLHAQMLMHGFVDQFAPTVPFPFLVHRPLNWALRFSLKKWVFPQAIPKMLESAQDATHPSALSLALIEALSKYVDGIKPQELASLFRFSRLSSFVRVISAGKNGPSTESASLSLNELSFIGTAQKLSKVLSLSGLKTPNKTAVESLLQEFKIVDRFHYLSGKNKEDRSEDECAEIANLRKSLPKYGLIEEYIKMGMKDGLLAGADFALSHFLSLGFEPLYALLFSALNDMLYTPLQTTRQDLETATDALESTCLDKADKFIESAKRELLEGIAHQESSDTASKIFQKAKEEIQTIFNDVRKIALALRAQIGNLKDTPSKIFIYPHLRALQEKLRNLPSKESLEELLKRTNDSEREAVFEALSPLYEKVANLFELLAPLAKSQGQHDVELELFSTFTTIDKTIETALGENYPSPSLKAIQTSLKKDNLESDVSELLDRATSFETLVAKKEKIEIVKVLLNELKNLVQTKPSSSLLGFDLSSPFRNLQKEYLLKQIQSIGKENDILSDHLESTLPKFCSHGEKQDWDNLNNSLLTTYQNITQSLSDQRGAWATDVCNLRKKIQKRIQEKTGKLSTIHQDLISKAESLLTKIPSSEEPIPPPTFSSPLTMEICQKFLLNTLPELVKSSPLVGNTLGALIGQFIEQVDELLKKNASKEEFQEWLESLPKNQSDLALPLKNKTLRSAWMTVLEKIAGVTIPILSMHPISVPIGAVLYFHADRTQTQQYERIQQIPALAGQIVKKVQEVTFKEARELSRRALRSLNLGNGILQVFLAKAAVSLNSR